MSNNEFTPEQQNRIEELKKCSKTELTKMIVRLEAGQPAVKPQNQNDIIKVQAERLPMPDPKYGEIKQLKAAAEKSGLTTGYYFDWQLQHLANHAMQQMGKEAISFVNFISECYTSFLELGITLFDVTGFVRRTPPHQKLYTENDNKERVYPVSEDDAKRISGNFVKYVMMQRQLNDYTYRRETPNRPELGEIAIQELQESEQILAELGASIERIVSGIDKLIRGKDSGEMLRQGANDATADFHSVTQWVSSIAKQGAPEQESIKRLMKRTYQYRDVQKLRWSDVWEMLVDYYYNNELTGHEEEEKEKLDEYEKGGGLDTLKRHYNRWKNENGT